MAGFLLMAAKPRRWRNWLAISLAVFTTAFAILLVLNLTLGDKNVDRVVPSLYAVEDEQFTRTFGALLGPALIGGNRASVLLNGDQIFPAMLDALRAARKTITFEMYIYWSGKVGAAFAEVLAERAQAGVKVHVLIDAVGSGKIDDAYIEQMEKAGVEVRRYNPPRWYSLGRFNNRTHRKLVVIDGAVGFTGGVGIADQWQGNAEDPEHWRDTHFRLEGPAVAQLQAAFMDNWTEASGNVLHGSDYFPALEAVGAQRAQVFMSSPGGGAESMQLMYLLSIAAARKSIALSASYFIPDEVAIRTFVQALRRGVKVRILLPGPYIDADMVQSASRAEWGRLLEAGAEIHEYQPTMFHCKVMVVDGIWTSVGSTNFDNRSFAVNDEANLNIYDRDFAKQQMEIFEADLTRARRISYDEWRNRPWTEKLWEQAMGLLSSQL